MIQQKLSCIQNLKIHGRTSKNLDPLTLFWTSSGVEVNFKGSELWIEVEVNYNTYEPWIYLLLNDELISRQMVVKGNHKICLLRGMNKDTIKNVKILKDTQAMSGDKKHCFQILSFISDGSFEELHEPKIKFEFIGDSLTSGEGTVGSKKENDWLMPFMSGYYCYATGVSKHFGADFNVISQSGWGVCSGWNNDPTCIIPPYYEQVCGLLTGKTNTDLGAKDNWDFNQFIPNVIVINLGTNDEAALFGYPPFEHKKVLYKQTSISNLMEGIKNFIIKVRKNNPDAFILWAYNMCNKTLTEDISNTVEEYKIEYNDKNAGFITLEYADDKMLGSLNHPGKLSHESATKRIINYLTEKNIILN
ncbi:hypothetical protein AN640_06760 [Candidatus Epulonipiscium fishelsonii]|uniref:Uncharacterized protein n=1 Tax=Candidatus Epulonipiscium fishelsonii TaxID=77094 RepID=A0ACC8XHJ4_9FIRM|nr:hypothetical protein AN640_06760 [Epulopiscium sp. SCG-D08WGA-EpuloA1]OON90377.1 MAG: hypothetical protein ATN32_04090 [Epulopiscium sp. AS2M-Bin002]